MASWLCRRVVVAVVVVFAVSADGASLDRQAALALLSQRTGENRTNFFVYRDADSGSNHGVASGFFGAVDKIHIDPACVDDPAAPLGCSSDPARLDRVRGNVLRITFAALSPSEFAGVSIEEPENWGAQNRGAGYDLRGATALIFDVRAPSGMRVQFGVNGKTTDFLQMNPSATFNTITIPLDSLHPALADVHLLFTVVTNGGNAPNGGTLLLDDIRFTPAPANRQTALGLPLSTQTFGVVSSAEAGGGRVPFPPDQTNRNVATIYEAALTLQALLDRGTADDRVLAAAIADTLVYAVAHDNRGLSLPKAADGATGVHSGYESGDIALLNDQGAGAGAAGDVRLAGYTASKSCGSSHFCQVLDDATGGNAAFAILALLDAYDAFGDAAYLDAARTIGKWIYANLHDPSTAGFGGYFLGYGDEGSPKTDVVLTKTTENNADIFAAFARLAAEEAGAKQPSDVSAAEWTRRAGIAGDFVMAMFDAGNGRFFAGTVPKGTAASNGIDPVGPEKGNDVVNTFDFLDANTFAVLAMADTPRYRAAIDWRRPVSWIAAKSLSVTAAGTLFTGFNLVPVPSAGPKGIAWEFTGQAIVAMRLVDCIYGGPQKFADAVSALSASIAQAQAAAPFGDGRGLVAATMQDGDGGPVSEQCLTTPFQCIPERVGLAATAWAIFADAGLNPLSTAGTLKICQPKPRRRAAKKV